MSDTEIIAEAELSALAARAFENAGLTPEDAATTARHLVLMDLMGVSTHGVHRLEQYLKRIEAGVVKPRAEITVDDKAPSLAVVAGGDGHLTSAQLDALLGTAFTQAGDPLFGLRVGRANHYRDLGPLGALMAASETLEQALLVLLRYRELMLPYLALALHRGEHQCTLTVS